MFNIVSLKQPHLGVNVLFHPKVAGIREICVNTIKSCQESPMQFENPINQYTYKHVNNQFASAKINQSLLNLTQLSPHLFVYLSSEWLKITFVPTLFPDICLYIGKSLKYWLQYVNTHQSTILENLQWLPFLINSQFNSTQLSEEW